jgi:hypothetical protein
MRFCGEFRQFVKVWNKMVLAESGGANILQLAASSLFLYIENLQKEEE